MNNQLNRLLFLQGGKCFFCGKNLDRSKASVEHLLAKASGGDNMDGNCVAVCKTVNQMLGCLSLKEKLRVIMLNSPNFYCPDLSAGLASTESQDNITSPTATLEPIIIQPTPSNQIPRVSELAEKYRINMIARAVKNRPRKLSTLTKDIMSHSGALQKEAQEVITILKNLKLIEIEGTTISY